MRPTSTAIGRGKKVTAKKNCSCERRKTSSVIEPSSSARRYGLFMMSTAARMRLASAVTRGARLAVDMGSPRFVWVVGFTWLWLVVPTEPLTGFHFECSGDLVAAASSRREPSFLARFDGG